VNIKKKIYFELERRKKDGIVITDNVPIRMRVTYAGHLVDLSTGHRIDEKKWDANRQQVKNGCTNKLKVSSAEINADLQHYGMTIQNVFKGFEVQNTVPSPTQLRSEFHKKTKNIVKIDKKKSSKSFFFSEFDEYMEQVGKANNWRPTTKKALKVVKNHVERFDKKTTFEKINEQWLVSYMQHLIDNVGQQNTTVEKQISLLKWFLRWAAKKGHLPSSAFDWKPKLKTTQQDIIYLEPEELEKIRRYAIPKAKEYLERMRDVFLFLCYTGLRHSDAYKLRRSNIKKKHIEITTVKTADSISIPLNKRSRAILKKYEDVPFPDGKILPIITNQNSNRFLKELLKLAKINEPTTETYYKGGERIDIVRPKYELIGTHCGRRTFASYLASNGIEPQVIMQLTGHKSFSAMKPYIKIADRAKVAAMSKIDKM